MAESELLSQPSLMAQASPQYSADGRWYWDGAKWLPATTAPTAASRAIPPRHRRILVIVGIAVAVLGGLWFGWNVYMGFTHTFQIDTTLAATNHAVVGGPSSFTVTVTNTSGSDINNFVIFVHPEGGDDWFKHHVVTSSGTCVADRSQGLFKCGPIAKGSKATFTIQGTPTDPGTFNYVLNYGDDRGGGDISWAQGKSPGWTETVSR